MLEDHTDPQFQAPMRETLESVVLPGGAGDAIGRGDEGTAREPCACAWFLC